MLILTPQLLFWEIVSSVVVVNSRKISCTHTQARLFVALVFSLRAVQESLQLGAMLLLHHPGKTKQPNDIIHEENNVVITERGAVVELLNNHVIQAANSVAQVNDSDYG